MSLSKKEVESLRHHQPTEYETAHDYRTGGFLAVDVDTELGNLRYEVIRKLGHGQLATVFLALDTKGRHWVALKIFNGRTTKKMEKNENFNQIIEKTKSCKYVIPELDRFKEKGLNGEHLCQVYDVMGPNVNMLWETLLDEAVNKKMVQHRVPLTRSLVKQALLGLQELHGLNIVHGNMDMANWFLEINDLSDTRRKKLDQDFEEPDSFIENVKQKGAPERIMADEPLFNFLNINDGLKLKLGGLYSAFFEKNGGETSEGRHPNLHLRTPEMILNGSNGQFDRSIDIWAIGCIIFEMITGSKLFNFTKTKSKEVDDQHLIEMNAIIGALPENLVSNWKPSHLYAKCVGDHGHITPPEDLKHTPILEAHFDNLKPSTIDDAEGNKIKSLLRNMLQHDPSKRPTVDEVLAHEWFKEVQV